MHWNLKKKISWKTRVFQNWKTRVFLFLEDARLLIFGRPASSKNKKTRVFLFFYDTLFGQKWRGDCIFFFL